MITKKHAVANNLLVEDFDVSKPTNNLMYWMLTTSTAG